MANEHAARMGAVHAAMALSHVEDVSDGARARELYKYYQPNPQAEDCLPLPQLASPPRASLSSSAASVTCAYKASSDTALTAFAQLVVLKLAAERAFISLVDSSSLYFMAESTKSVDLLEPGKHAEGDGLWLGCGSSSKAGSFCEKTIAVKATSGGRYPAFIVNDTQKDDRFKDMPFVVGPPYIRFHAGVPLITKRGVPIGSLFVLDRQPRNGMTEAHRQFMGQMAMTIMKHLEMLREVEEHRKGMKMSRGLASFVEGRSELAEAEVDHDADGGRTIAGDFETDHQMARTRSKTGSVTSLMSETVPVPVSVPVPVPDNGRLEREPFANMTIKDNITNPLGDEQTPPRPNVSAGSLPASFLSTTHSRSTPNADLLDKSSGTDDVRSEASTIKLLFSRAANLIREAFEVNGGAVFYDAQKGFSTESQRDTPLESSESSEEMPAMDDGLYSPLGWSPTSTNPHARACDDSPSLGDGAYTRSAKESERPVELLGFSTSSASSINQDDHPGPSSFIPFDEQSLHKLLRRFPRGKLWVFESDGSVSSSSEDEPGRLRRQATTDLKEIQGRQRRRARNVSDGKFLLKHFPGVRQLLFIPLWDAGRARWLSGCCVWSTEPTRILTRQNELLFLSAFSNSVMAECYRIDTEVANQKKSDFIGSISHELRSPLHGILASAEFLLEDITTGFARSLVETVDSCGRTLLDTINHILDYSKINNFEKNWKRNRKAGFRPLSKSTNSALLLQQPDMPMLNLFADVDLSILSEEVFQDVYAGFNYQSVTAPNFDTVAAPHRKMSDVKGLGSETAPNPQVSVILDIDPENYEFTTQPGAYRRIIMNLVGNALKYTSRGYVRLALEVKNGPIDGNHESNERSNVIVTISDTGKGISAEFLRSKLFTAFAQENSLSTGVGLGLSIVKSIVTLLEGDITFDSELGRGTQVKVTIPLLRNKSKQHDSTSSTPYSIVPMPKVVDEPISTLRARILGQSAILYGFDLDAKDPMMHKMGQLLKASIKNYLIQWFGMKVVPPTQKARIIIVNEADPSLMSQIVAKTAGQKPEALIVVLCSHPSHFERIASMKGSPSIGYVAKPAGPLKLSRAITQCLDGESPSPESSARPSLGGNSSSNSDLTNVFEEIPTNPNHGEVLDNSRMAADSLNARKAIESPTPNAIAEKASEFPFGVLADEGVNESASSHTAHPSPTKPKRSSFIVPNKESKRSSLGSISSTITLKPRSESSEDPSKASSATSQPKRRTPTLLLVDDNMINRTLLYTYLRKRNYAVLDQAENGLEAVMKFEERPAGYDIIFMDISMPILDGFGATRQIRAIEASRRRRAAELSAANNNNPRSPLSQALRHRDSIHAGTRSADDASGKDDGEGLAEGALIIALTGLASSRDQNEALTSGIDLFLTKPVAFKEVGQLLDNWEANGERDLGKQDSSEGAS